MNDQLIQRARAAIEAIAAEHDLTLERIVVYGSQTRDDHAPDSDLDIVLVSDDWEAQPDHYARPLVFLLDWPRDELPVPDIVPVTTAEFDRRRRADHDIVRTAVETGVTALPPEA